MEGQPAMKSSTRSITLVLVGSVLAGGAIGLASGGFQRDEEGGDWDRNNNSNGGHRRAGFIPIPIFLGGGAGRAGGGVSAPHAPAPSARGGFGGTGTGFGTSSAS
jgi:hypothetical protein